MYAIRFNDDGISISSASNGNALVKTWVGYFSKVLLVFLSPS